MKFKILSVALIIIPFNLFAASISINFGINHSWLYYPDLLALKNEFNLNYSVGINYNQTISPNSKLSFGLRYFNIGRYDEIQTDNLVEIVEMRHKYISLRIKVEYELFGCISPYLNIEPSLQVNSNYEHSVSPDLDDERTITEEMNKFNLFTGLGIKYNFTVIDQSFSLSGLINFGLLRISKDIDFDNSSRSWFDWRGREILLNLEYYIGI